MAPDPAAPDVPAPPRPDPGPLEPAAPGPRRGLPRPSGLPGLRIFSSSARSPRLRRPTDVLLLIAAIGGTVAVTVAAPGPTNLDTATANLVGSLPGLVDWLWQFGYLLVTTWSVVLVLVFVFARGRRRVLGDLGLAAALALGAALLAGRAAGTGWSTGLGALAHTGPPAVYVATRFAVATAVVMAASPHLSRPMRDIGRGVLLLGGVAATALGVTFAIGSVAGFLVGVGAAALVHLLLGSPDGRLTPAQVSAALADLGVVCTEVREARLQPTGVALLEASAPDGRPLLVKVYGRDAWDGQLLASVWSTLWRKGETPRLTGSRLELVEHEAVATLLAERGGVVVAPVVAVGLSADGDGLLVAEGGGRALSDHRPGEVSEAALAGAWRSLLRLHDLGISHGRIDGQRVVVRPDGTAALTDLADAELSASDVSLTSDSARLLVVTALAVGHDAAVAAAREALGADGLAAVLPFLQPAVLDRATRAAVSSGAWDLASLRAHAVDVAGVQPPPLQRLQRVTVRSALILAGGALLAYIVISRLSGINFAQLWAELRSANVWWLVAALVVSPMAQVATSFATVGASIAPVRYGPVLMLQYAIQFVAVVLPATAARLALEIRFFERFGIAAAGALSIGVIDSVSGFAVQVVLLGLIALSPLPGLTGQLDSSSSAGSSASGSSTTSLLILIVVLLVVGLCVAAVLPSNRARVREAGPRIRATVRSQAGQARTALGVVRHPVKVAEMLAGNLGGQLIQAATLGLCLRAYGGHAHFSQLILINTLVSLFAGLMPVPGGVGVAEAGLTAGLEAVGIPTSVAISTALAFRLVTFYLPPLWGSVAMRWLRRHSYV